MAESEAERLRDPASVDRARPSQLFELRDGTVAVDVRWIDPPLLPGPELLANDPQWQALDAAWKRWRADGDRSWVDSFSAAPEEESSDAVAAGVVLLHASAGLAPPDWARARVALMLPERAIALAARCAELGEPEIVPQLQWELRHVAARREALRAVRDVLPQLTVAREVTLLGSTGHAISWFPDLRRGVVQRSPIFANTRSDYYVTGIPLPAGAIRIAPGLGITPGAAEATLPSITTILAGLVLAFLLGLGLLLRMLRREHAAITARADFLISVTHELKTPLASIRLLGEMLGDAPPEKQAEYLAMLEGESARLAALVENVLDLGRLERKERAYDKRPQSLAELVRAVVRGFAPVATKSGVDVQLDESGEPIEAVVDRNAIAQALLNVLENARRYAAAGGRITVATALGSDGFELRVRDHGPGIPDDERERIFERFRRGRAQRDGSVPGLGIGLHLARTILRDHGGDLRCVPPPDGGLGACFLFTLPVRAEANA